MNWVFAVLLVGAVLWGAATGSMPAVGAAALSSAMDAVRLAVVLLAQMMLWLGILGVLREAGAVRALGRALAPILRRLLPQVPATHPAYGAIVMNLSANMLGLSNAATPFGLQAMAELQKLNPHRVEATNAMALFLAVNTTGIAVIPVSAIAVRASLGSSSPAAIVLPTLVTTFCATLIAVATAKRLERASPALVESPAPSDETQPTTIERTQFQRRQLFGWLALAVLVVAIAARAFTTGVDSSWLIPVLVGGTVALGVARGVSTFSTFVESAKEGMRVTANVLPYLIAMLVAVGMLRASGALGWAVDAVAPLLAPIGFPAAALPMALIRPFSGSGALAVMADTMKVYGTDSHVGLLVSTINGGTETTFYVLALYFGSIGVTRFRHTVAACAVADIAAPIIAHFAVRFFVS